MTFGWWSRQYQAYKDDFDTELTMKAKGLRYNDMETEETLDDAIPF
jgi:hypothetical protein